MDKKTDQLIDEQIRRLPHELNIFATSPDWQRVLDEISVRYALTKDVATSIKFEVLLTLIGLADPDAFKEELVKILLTRAETIDDIVAEVEQKIFAPIRPALIQFFESEQAKEVESEKLKVESGEKDMANAEPIQSTTYNLQPTPENLSIEKNVESSFIKLIPKVATPDNQPAHPFEEKMRQVFTGASIEIGNTPNIPPATLTGNLHHDPYREAVE